MFAEELPSAEYGDSLSANTLVLAAGFPDDLLSSWKPLIDRLERFDCRIIVLCYPGYEKRTGPNGGIRVWGYNFEDLIERMNNTLNRLCPCESFSLIVHDWGSFLGMRYQNKYPSRVKNLVTLDIGLPGRLSYKEFAVMTLYQGWFAVSYAISQAVNYAVGNWVFKLSFRIASVLPFFSPVPHDTLPRSLDEINVAMAYPYYYFWTGLLRRTLTIPQFPSCPILFMV